MFLANNTWSLLLFFVVSFALTQSTADLCIARDREIPEERWEKYEKADGNRVVPFSKLPCVLEIVGH